MNNELNHSGQDFFVRHYFGNCMEFFIASFDIFFIVCCCKIEQFSVLKPSYLSFLWAVSTQLTFNECLQEIQKKKRIYSAPKLL